MAETCFTVVMIAFSDEAWGVCQDHLAEYDADYAPGVAYGVAVLPQPELDRLGIPPYCRDCAHPKAPIRWPRVGHQEHRPMHERRLTEIQYARLLDVLENLGQQATENIAPDAETEEGYIVVRVSDAYGPTLDAACDTWAIRPEEK